MNVSVLSCEEFFIVIIVIDGCLVIFFLFEEWKKKVLVVVEVSFGGFLVKIFVVLDSYIMEMVYIMFRG